MFKKFDFISGRVKIILSDIEFKCQIVEGMILV